MRLENSLAQEKLEFLAHHDPLTGLPNRLLLIDRYNRAAALAKRDQTHVAVLFLDLDNFKQVNENLGHGYGDQLMVSVANDCKPVSGKPTRSAVRAAMNSSFC